MVAVVLIFPGPTHDLRSGNVGEPASTSGDVVATDTNRERQSTFHDQWYLVENLAPALRPEVTIRRQDYWGTLWYILTEPDNNAHFRLSQEGMPLCACWTADARFKISGKHARKTVMRKA